MHFFNYLGYLLAQQGWVKCMCVYKCKLHLTFDGVSFPSGAGQLSSLFGYYLPTSFGANKPITVSFDSPFLCPHLFIDIHYCIRFWCVNYSLTFLHNLHIFRRLMFGALSFPVVRFSMSITIGPVPFHYYLEKTFPRHFDTVWNTLNVYEGGAERNLHTIPQPIHFLCSCHCQYICILHCGSHNSSY